MPTYFNESNYTRVVGGISIEPKQKGKLLAYYNLKGLDGVSIVDPFPYYSSIVFSEKITQNQEVKLPEFDSWGNFLERFVIHFYVEEGEVEINFNISKNKVPLKLYEKAKWNIRLPQRLIDKIFISSLNEKSFFKCWLIIEKMF